jgi:modification methylase
MRSDWLLPICNGQERLKKNGKKVHSTQKPEALLHRIILATTNKGDSVFDPFLGTGTTAVVAKKLGRKYYGIERDKKYFNAAEERVSKTRIIEDNYLDTIENNKSKPRVPFGSLVELGILKPGTTLFDLDKKINAKIMVDGSIKYKEAEGSIHKVAAKIVGAESYNGWTYWYCNINGAIVPIDSLRQKFISEKRI